MSNIAKKTKIFTKAYNIFNSMDSYKELMRNNLSLSDYHVIRAFMIELSTLKDITVKTFISNVAEWFAKQGFNVAMSTDKTYYSISII